MKMEENAKEMRRIRIALIAIAIILIFVGGGQEIVTENNTDNVPTYFHQTIPLQDGHFGILTNDATWDDGGQLHIYYYDHEANEVTLKKELSIDDLQYDDE